MFFLLSYDDFLKANFKKSIVLSYDMQSVLIGSEYPVMDTLLFYFPESSYCKAFRGVAECCAFSCFHNRFSSIALCE